MQHIARVLEGADAQAADFGVVPLATASGVHERAGGQFGP